MLFQKSGPRDDYYFALVLAELRVNHDHHALTRKVDENQAVLWELFDFLPKKDQLSYARANHTSWIQTARFGTLIEQEAQNLCNLEEPGILHT